MRLVLASANPDKSAEIAAILGAAVPGLDLASRPADVPDVDEVGTTLLENARLKAAAIAEATGEPAVADDTGLEVDALDGAPGVRSARFAGPAATSDENVDKLLAALAGVPPGSRRARFRTVAAACLPDGRELVAEGAVDGVITGARRGSGGFGYDSVFVPDDGDGRTFAEMTLAEKQAVSHRFRAFSALATTLLVALDHRHGG